MLYQFLTLKFWLVVGLGGLIAFGFALVACRYQGTGSRKIRPEFLWTPTNSTLTVISFLAPVIAGVTGYLYSQNPSGDYSVLLAMIVLLFAGLLVALWESFALVKKGTEAEYIQLNFPADVRFIQGIGIAFALLFYSLGCLAYFLLVEITPLRQHQSIADPGMKHLYSIQHLPVRLNQTRDQVIKNWGEPLELVNNEKYIYSTQDSLIEISFDNHGIARQIIERRK